METTLRYIPDDAIFEEDNTTFHAILLYENREGAEVAKTVLDRVCVRLPETVTTRISPWRFDSLKVPLTKRLADLEAREADVVIVSASGLKPLPLEVKQALENWASGKVAARQGFVALLTEVREHEKRESRVHQEMADLCAQTGSDFFSRGLNSHRDHPRFRIEDRAEAGLVEQEFMAAAAPARRWGIND